MNDSPSRSSATKKRAGIPGFGLLQGLAVSGRNLVESFFRKERMTTVQYPEEKSPISPNFRNFPFLAFDGEDPIDGLRCVACSICEKECPPQCIYIVLDRDEAGKSLKRPKVFDIDISVCMNCGICAEVCPFDAIYMDGEYEIATEDRFDALLLRKEQLSKPESYHLKLRPLEAEAVREKRRAEEEKKAAAAAAKKAKEAKEAAEKAAAAAETVANPPASEAAPEGGAA
jgi:NADH-quinone oxidoreductase subunit I